MLQNKIKYLIISFLNTFLHTHTHTIKLALSINCPTFRCHFQLIIWFLLFCTVFAFARKKECSRFHIKKLSEINSSFIHNEKIIFHTFWNVWLTKSNSSLYLENKRTKSKLHINAKLIYGVFYFFHFFTFLHPSDFHHNLHCNVRLQKWLSGECENFKNRRVRIYRITK